MIPIAFSTFIIVLIVKVCIATFKKLKQRTPIELSSFIPVKANRQHGTVPRIHVTECRQRPPSLGDLPPSYNETVDVPPWTRTGVSQDIVYPNTGMNITNITNAV